MTNKILFVIIYLPIIASLVSLLIPKNLNIFRSALAIAIAVINLLFALELYRNGEGLELTKSWSEFGLGLFFKVTNLNAMLVLTSAFVFAIGTLYTYNYYKKNAEIQKSFIAFLLMSMTFANGALFASNFITLLIFWEAIMIVLLGFILLGGKHAYKTAVKAFIIIGITDLCLMFGMGLYYNIAGTLDITKLAVDNVYTNIAFMLMMIGALGKLGVIPFQSWLPDAAVDAPTPFMIIIVSAIEKILGVYLGVILITSVFNYHVDSISGTILITIACLSIVLASLLMIVQDDYKKLITYSSISQAGYMLLAMAIATPFSIVAAIFHLINHSFYKSGLFMVAGEIEKTNGSTNLREISGTGRNVIFVNFVILAAALCGIMPLNGFYSKEMIMGSALNYNSFLYIVTMFGALMSLMAYLKAFGVFSNADKKQNFFTCTLCFVPTLSISVLVLIISALHGDLVLKISKAIGVVLEKEDTNYFMILASFSLIIVAILHNFVIAKKKSHAAVFDYFKNSAPLAPIYGAHSRKRFDPFEWFHSLMDFIGKVMFEADKIVDGIYERVTFPVAMTFSSTLRSLHTGSYKLYIIWVLAAVVAVFAFMLKSLNG